MSWPSKTGAGARDGRGGEGDRRTALDAEAAVTISGQKSYGNKGTLTKFKSFCLVVYKPLKAVLQVCII